MQTLTIGRYRKQGKIIYKDGRIWFNFGYWPELNAELKKMKGCKWHGFENPPLKMWSVEDCQRNRFQLAYLQGENPYARYDNLKFDFTPKRSLYSHQKEMVEHGLAVHYGIWAAEMGCGKTLSAIELIEQVGNPEVFFIGTKASLRAVRYEFEKWQATAKPHFYTYEQLVKIINDWPAGKKAPRIVIFDESSKIKTPTAQRSVAAKHLADSVRQDWGYDGYVILMSGSPAPKSPIDWWHQCEVACPGFIVEGDTFKFQSRLGIVAEKENAITGGKYAHLVAWKDNTDRCVICGKMKNDHDVDFDNIHDFKACKNEIAYLYERLKGLVVVKFKKDCLDLPEKQYRTIRLEPSASILRTAKAIINTAPTAIRRLEALRELSDGFQYVESPSEKRQCERCHGTKKTFDYQPTEGFSEPQKVDIECPNCDENGMQQMYDRSVKEIPCPKDDAVVELLGEHEEIGRIVIYAGFTASIDRIVNICNKEGWATIRVDGRGWHFTVNGQPETTDPLKAFQDMPATYPKIAFVGHPGSAGMGLTLTKSPTIVYFSNDFNAESRIQSEDRIHRPGMDTNRGATIIDLVHLPTDEKILTNLRQKRQLQSITMGELQAAMEEW